MLIAGDDNEVRVPSAYNALDLSCEIEEASFPGVDLEVDDLEQTRHLQRDSRVPDERKPPRSGRRNNKRKSNNSSNQHTRSSAKVDVGGQTDLDLEEQQLEHHEAPRTKKSRMTYDEFGNIEDDICIVEDEDDPDYGAPPPANQSVDEASGADPTTSTRTRGRSMENIISMDPLLNSEAYEVDINSLKLPFGKIQVLQSLEDPAAIFEKDSVEFKLASSILYDFGKELAHVCPYDGEEIKAKVFFHQNFKNFIAMFPCLKSDLIKDIRIAKKSAEAHLKNNARGGFNSVFDKKKKDVGAYCEG